VTAPVDGDNGMGYAAVNRATEPVIRHGPETRPACVGT